MEEKEVKKEMEEFKGFDKDIWPQIQFHNERIYKNLELFIQITLAICGGLAYLAVNIIAGNKALVKSVVQMAAGIQLLLGIYTSLAISMHALSAIRRYENKTGKALFWLEPYMIIFILTISGLIAYFAYFKIGEAILIRPRPPGIR